jgi:hypothetical protein
MKAQMLKIAGVKSEKEFYKKFPDEASFMKAHGKEFKKAMRANKVKKAQTGFEGVAPSPIIDESTIERPAADVDYGYLFEDQQAKQKAQDAERDAAILGRSTTGQNWDVKNPTGQDLTDMRAAQAKLDNRANFAKKASPYIQAGSDVMRGISMIKQQKQAVKQAKQMANLTGVQAAAVASTPVQPIKNQYVRPEDNVIQQDQLFPSQGVGTNVLAEYGAMIGGNPTEIQNTFAPNTIYSDMGYEPLSDSDRVKQYQQGGQLYGMLNDSKFGDVMNQGGGNVLNQLGTAITGEEDAGTAIGGGIGQAAGTAIAGPVGGMVGKFAGKLLGDLIDGSERKIKKAQKQTRKNQASIMGSQFGAGIQNMFSANVRNGGDVPKAQGGKEEKGGDKDKGWINRAANAQLRKDEKCESHPGDPGKGAVSSISYGDVPATPQQLYPTRYKTLYSQMPSDKKERRAIIDAFEKFRGAGTSPYVKDYSPEDYQAALYEANIYNNNMRQSGYEKYFDPTTGAVLPEYATSFNNPTMAFYRSKFPQAKQITPEQIINLMPLEERKALISRGYKQRDGGQTSDYEWISHTWQPQVITHFGEHKVSDLLRPPADADMLRTGGSIRQNYVSPEEEMMTQMALGGQLKTTWGGYAEPISHNPYMPSTGQTVMFRGQSHDESDGKGRTGIGVKYGKHDSYTDYAEYGTEADADVEVERNEPAVELPNGDGENSMVVYGNLKIPNQFLHEIGDPKAKGKKFKTYVKDLAKKEQRQNKIIDKSSEKLDGLDPNSPFDMLKLNSLAANIQGANMKLKQYADFKTNAAAVQNAINDTAEEMGLDADTLAKGRVKIDKSAFQGEARYGKSVPKAQDGLKTELGESITEDQLKELNALYEKAKSQKTGDSVLAFQRKFHEYLPKAALRFNKETKFLTAKAKKLGVKKEDLDKIDPSNLSGDLEKRVLQGNEDKYFGPITTKYMEIATKAAKKKDVPEVTKFTPIPKPAPPTPAVPTTPTTTNYPITPYKQNPYLEAIAAALPYLRPTDMEELDPRQIMGEMYALSTNQVEPVQAQKVQPRLSVPIDISLQDILNENRATLRRQQQLVGYNPAAQSAFSAQEYEMNQKVLAEQFRLNQAEKQRVYEKNRDILNQNDLTNLGIFDRQYERQATALSKTKATAQEALNSISSKILQNRLENRTLATMENLYGYRFDPNFRTMNYQTAGFNIPTVYAGPDGKYYKANQTTGQLEEIRTPNIGANFTMPSLATPPIVPAGTVTTVDGQQLTPITPSAPVTVPADRSPLISRPGLISDAAEEYEDLYRKGGSVKKNKKAKEDRNSSIVRALKNL